MSRKKTVHDKILFLKERKALLYIVGSTIGLAVLYTLIVTTAPFRFPTGTVFRIEEGQSLQQISDNLEDYHYIRSSSVFQTFVSVMGKSGSIPSGDYTFDSRVPLWNVLSRLIRGDHGNAYTWITFREGISVSEMSRLVAERFPQLSADKFQELAEPYEGYLFPDTYHFSKLATERDIVMKMRRTFDIKTKDIQNKMSRDEFRRIIIIASLLEREATGLRDARMVAGIIKNRLDKKMPLQLDATLGYLTGRSSAQLTRSDLKTDSPYNTYKNKGLPPGPIANPGVGMIESAMNPQSNEYFYYLHDSAGNPHYAVTHDEHVRNKQQYLR